MINKETYTGKKDQLFIGLSPIIVLTLTWLGARLSISRFHARKQQLPHPLFGSTLQLLTLSVLGSFVPVSHHYDTNCCINLYYGCFVDALYEQKDIYEISHSLSFDS
jgi:hypothetical protein